MNRPFITIMKKGKVTISFDLASEDVKSFSKSVRIHMDTDVWESIPVSACDAYVRTARMPSEYSCLNKYLLENRQNDIQVEVSEALPQTEGEATTVYNSVSPSAISALLSNEAVYQQHSPGSRFQIGTAHYIGLMNQDGRNFDIPFCFSVNDEDNCDAELKKLETKIYAAMAGPGLFIHANFKDPNFRGNPLVTGDELIVFSGSKAVIDQLGSVGNHIFLEGMVYPVVSEHKDYDRRNNLTRIIQMFDGTSEIGRMRVEDDLASIQRGVAEIRAIRAKYGTHGVRTQQFATTLDQLETGENGANRGRFFQVQAAD